MTLIAAIAREGKVFMLADSFTGYDNRQIQDTRKKIWITEDKVIGCAGNLRPALAFRYGFEWPQQEFGQDDDEYMRYAFPSALRDFLQENIPNDTHEGTDNSNLYALIGWRGRIWSLFSDYSVVETSESYDAIGSGAEVALGALTTLSPELSPTDRLQDAAVAAAKFIDSVCGPFTVLVEP